MQTQAIGPILVAMGSQPRPHPTSSGFRQVLNRRSPIGKPSVVFTYLEQLQIPFRKLVVMHIFVVS